MVSHSATDSVPKVMLVHNEHIVEEQPACGETLCSVGDFKAYYQHIVDFDWDTECPVGSGTTTTTTTTTHRSGGAGNISSLVIIGILTAFIALFS